jgi:hypothetical protein
MRRLRPMLAAAILSLSSPVALMAQKTLEFRKALGLQFPISRRRLASPQNPLRSAAKAMPRAASRGDSRTNKSNNR